MAVRTINSVRNLQWANKEHTMIDMEVDFDELDEEYVPFTAVETGDPEPHTAVLWANAIAGVYGPIAEWIPPEDVTGVHAMERVRSIRDSLLAETDYIEMPTRWSRLTTEQQEEWSTYRNALRDLPATYPNVELKWDADYTDTEWFNIVWPTKPEE